MTRDHSDPGRPPADDTLSGHRAVHELVAAQAAQRPDAVALVCGTDTVTYGELNARANRLARYLVSRGVGVESRVALCLERGIDLVVALLAIWKAGGTSVPLDPDHPADRLRFMVADTRPTVLLSGLAVVGTLPRLPAGVTRVVLDETATRAALRERADTDPTSPAGPDNLAHIIFTSGSTGTPKGVMIHHRGLSHRLRDMSRRYHLSPDDRTLQFASIVFDAAAEQIFPTLFTGGVVILRPEETWSADRIVREIRHHRVTVADLTPAVWEQVVAALDEPTGPSSVSGASNVSGPSSVDNVDSVESSAGLGGQFRLMVLGGEQVPRRAVSEWFARTAVALHNTYGPTETTITSTAHLITREHPDVHIGRPVSDTEAYVVDPAGGLAAVGEAGELWIGGVGVSRGYWDRPALTARRFVPDPFGPGGGRLYRTGDLVRRLPDGGLEFVGRIDRQVKVRGLRIELGEIETVLARHPDVASAVVTVREDAEGDSRLVAYCVAAGGPEPLGTDLRAWCKVKLPEYMVPGAFLFLPALPLTPNGKVDHAALPAPAGGTEAGDGYAAPRTEVERLVAEVWAEVLRVDRVGVHDNFFDLGGHSLLATKVVNRVERLVGLTVDLRTFFVAPTVAALADHLVELFAAAESTADHPGTPESSSTTDGEPSLDA